MFQITILLLYLLAAVAFAMSRLPRFASQERLFLALATAFAAIGIAIHGQDLFAQMNQANGLSVSLAGAVSLIGLQLALIGLIGALEPTLRGMTAGLLFLAAVAIIPMDMQPDVPVTLNLSWQLQAHILIAMFAYGLLTAGAIVAIYALIQDRRLKAGLLSSGNQLFAPLETTEKMLFSVTAAGFLVLLLAVLRFRVRRRPVRAASCAQNCFLTARLAPVRHSRRRTRVRGLARQTRRLPVPWGFAFLCIAYFGARYVLEELLNRSWG